MRSTPSFNSPPSYGHDKGHHHHPKPHPPPILVKDNDGSFSLDGSELITPRTQKRVTLNDTPIISGPAYAFFASPSPRHEPPMMRPGSSYTPVPPPPPNAAPSRKGSQKPPPPNITLLSVSWNQKKAPPHTMPPQPTSHPSPSVPPRRPSRYNIPSVQPSPRSALKKTPSNFSQHPSAQAVMNSAPISAPSYPPPGSSSLPPAHSTRIWEGGSSSSYHKTSVTAAGGGGSSRHGRIVSPSTTKPVPSSAPVLAPLHEGSEGEEDSEFGSSDGGTEEEEEGVQMASRRSSIPPRRSQQQPTQHAAVLPPRSSLPPRSQFTDSPSSLSSSPLPSWVRPTGQPQRPPQEHLRQLERLPPGVEAGERAGRRTGWQQDKVEEAPDSKNVQGGHHKLEEVNREAPSHPNSIGGAPSLAAATAAVVAAQRQQQRVTALREAERDRERLPHHLPLPMSSYSVPASTASSFSSSSTMAPSRLPPPKTQARNPPQAEVKSAIRRHLALGPFTSGLEWTMLACMGTAFMSIASMCAESAGFFVGYNDISFPVVGSVNLIDVNIGWNRFSIDLNGAGIIATRSLESISQSAYILGCVTFVLHLLCVGLSLATLGYIYNLRTYGRLSPLGGAYTHTRWLSGLQILLGLGLAGVGCMAFPWYVQKGFTDTFTPEMDAFHSKVGWAYALTLAVALLCLITGFRLLMGATKMDSIIAWGAGRMREGRRLGDIGRDREERKEEIPMRRPSWNDAGHGRHPPPPRPAFLSSV